MNASTATPRYMELDALRGFAVMGILLMNIVAFAMPEMAYLSPAIYGGMDMPDIISWAFGFIFVDGKMRGLFTLLFGASMMLVIARAQATGKNATKVHFSRMGWLAVFGLAHFFLLWWGDILFLYAAVGCVAFFMHDWDSRKLVRIALLIYAAGFVAYCGFMGSVFYLQSLAQAAGPGSAMETEYLETMKELAPSAAVIAEEIALYQSGYMDILIFKLQDLWMLPFMTILSNITETLPFMMLGMALFKNGFMTGQWESRRYKKIGYLLTLIGLGLIIPVTILVMSSGFEPVISTNAALAWSIPARLAMTIGYAALLILLIKTWSQTSLIRRVAAAGRVAFTNYIGTSIIMTFIFYGWGLGFFGLIGRAELYLFVIGAWILMLLWSKPWLMRFQYGPLEWLWRSLARSEIQKMRIEN